MYFPKIVLRLPPDRDIEFIIELLPGTALIYKVPYCMALAKLIEVKIYLQ